MSHLYKYRQQYIIAFLLFSFGFFSCSIPKSESKLAKYGVVFEDVMHSDLGTFRGFNLGDQLDTVKAKENAKLTESDQGYLYYESKITDSLGSYNISYSFDETGLNEIQSDIFINNFNSADSVFNQFKTYFDEHYGFSETHGGFNVWTVTSEKYGKVRINLSNESINFTVDKAPGKISIWIYPDKG